MSVGDIWMKGYYKLQSKTKSKLRIREFTKAERVELYRGKFFTNFCKKTCFFDLMDPPRIKNKIPDLESNYFAGHNRECTCCYEFLPIALLEDICNE